MTRKKDKPRALTARERKAIVSTPDKDLIKTFGDATRGFHWLIDQKRGLVAMQDAESVKERLARDIAKRETKRTVDTVRAKYSEAVATIEDLTARLDALIDMQQACPVPVIQAARSNRAREITPVFLLSDTHPGEVVLSEKVGGVNQYNKSIATQRHATWARNVVRMIELYRAIRTVRQIVIPILGDLGTGNIHEENLANTWCAPVQEAMFSQGLIIGALEYILEHGDVDRIVIPTAVGNHMRITRKPHNQDEVENSLELFIYAGIAQHFKNEKRVEVVMPQAYLSYINVMGVEMAYHHGHGVKYNGGIGGLAVPLLRFTHRQSSNRRADLYVCGHFHQRLDLGKAVVNGSLIGYNAFALKGGFEFEKPSQEMIIIDSLYGKSHSQPIWVE